MEGVDARSASGHVGPGEPPHQTIRRECLEELGVHVHHPLPVPMTFDDPTLDMHAFLVTRWDGEVVNAAPEEHDHLRWFRPRDLAELKLAHPASLWSMLTAVHVAIDEPHRPALIGRGCDRDAVEHEAAGPARQVRDR